MKLGLTVIGIAARLAQRRIARTREEAVRSALRSIAEQRRQQAAQQAAQDVAQNADRSTKPAGESKPNTRERS